MGLVASIVEAYGELRVNKGRVLLSLIGVAFSVFAMTVVLGGGGMMTSALTQQMETNMGRPAMLTVQGAGSPASDPAEAARRDDAVLTAFDRLGIEQRSRSTDVQLRIQTRRGVAPVPVKAVDPSYADMFRLRVLHGRWLARNDGRRLVPAAVIDEHLYDRIGRPPLGAATITAHGEGGAATELVVIGVVPGQPAPEGVPPTMAAYVHADAASTLPGQSMSGMGPSYLAWVPPEMSQRVQQALTTQLQEAPGGPFQAYQSGMSIEDMGFREVQYAILGVAGVILLLGALGLLNISMVTVRYRMREIGIRRSYGATGLRIFVGVLMESVVATVVAGAIGVTAAVALVKAPFVRDFFTDLGLVDLPPFPVTAVLVGLGAATLVGALAGIVPALIATRVKVIDAIRA